MAVTWEAADERLVAMAQEVIAKYRHELLDARIGFVMRSQATRSRGRKYIGRAEKLSDKMQVLLELDFLIWISKPDWLSFQPSQRKALLHHELCHCEWDADEGARILGHDIEEFHKVIAAHGLWMPDLEATARAIQPHLPKLEGRGKVKAVDPALMEPASA